MRDSVKVGIESLLPLDHWERMTLIVLLFFVDKKVTSKDLSRAGIPVFHFTASLKSLSKRNYVTNIRGSLEGRVRVWSPLITSSTSSFGDRICEISSDIFFHSFLKKKPMAKVIFTYLATSGSSSGYFYRAKIQKDLNIKKSSLNWNIQALRQMPGIKIERVKGTQKIFFKYEKKTGWKLF